MPSFLRLVNIGEINSPSQWVVSSRTPFSQSLRISVLIIFSSVLLNLWILTVCWSHMESCLNSMWQCWTLSRMKASEVNFSQLCANSFRLPAQNWVVLTRGKQSPWKFTIFAFLTSFVVCTFAGVAFKTLSPYSSLPLFVISDTGFRRGGAFSKKKDAVGSFVAENEVVDYGL